MTALALIGGGEQARVVAEAARALGYALHGAVANAVDPALTRLGGDDDLPRLAGTDRRWLVAIGGNALRDRLASAWDGRLAWATIIHPSAWVSPSSRLGAGVFVGPGAIIHAGATVGDHAIVNSGAIVEHDAVLGRCCHVAPGAVLGGGARIGDRALIALGARVRDHVAIGADATVGMGAAAVAEVRAGATVLGVPARERR